MVLFRGVISDPGLGSPFPHPDPVKLWQETRLVPIVCLNLPALAGVEGIAHCIFTYGTRHEVFEKRCY